MLLVRIFLFLVTFFVFGGGKVCSLLFFTFLPFQLPFSVIQRKFAFECFYLHKWRNNFLDIRRSQYLLQKCNPREARCRPGGGGERPKRASCLKLWSFFWSTGRLYVMKPGSFLAGVRPVHGLHLFISVPCQVPLVQFGLGQAKVKNQLMIHYLRKKEIKGRIRKLLDIYVNLTVNFLIIFLNFPNFLITFLQALPPCPRDAKSVKISRDTLFSPKN